MFKIEPYRTINEKEWDDFVLNESVNGTFLQTMNFLNYHPKDRFKDSSFIIRDKKNTIIAVCPACEIIEENNKILYSHKGSTFGGIIIRKRHYLTEKVLEIISEVDNYLKDEEYSSCFFKITPTLFAKKNADLLEYCLSNKGYYQYTELSTFIDFFSYKDKITSNFTQGKRTNVNNGIKANLIIKPIYNEYEIKLFYEILCENLYKYDTRPVHSLEELLDLKNNRLGKACQFYGVFKENEMIAGGMVFYFEQINIAHTQYLAAKQEYGTLSPSTFLYYGIINEMRKKNVVGLSWGISTDNQGKDINIGLTKSKEAYGSSYSLNRTFFKKF